MYINTSGLVIRETAYKDSSKILTVLTGSEGKLTVSARGALRRNSKLAAVTQLLAYSEMTLSGTQDRWTLTEARSVEQFIGLRGDIILLSLGSYFAELAEAASDEDSPSPELLPLCLNALYALSAGLKTPEYVKPAFELRLMSVSGFAPLIESCQMCGKGEPEHALLDMSGGTVFCGEHAPADATPLSPGALRAMRHIINSDQKKIYSFSISSESLGELTSAAEGYLLTHLDRRFRTLDYYKSIKPQ